MKNKPKTILNAMYYEFSGSEVFKDIQASMERQIKKLQDKWLSSDDESGRNIKEEARVRKQVLTELTGRVRTKSIE